MKLNGSVMVAVAMMVGSMALATGCNKPSDSTSQPETSPAPVAQQQPQQAQTEQSNPAAIPAAQPESTTVNASVRVGVGAHTPIYAPSAPPAPRYERVGRAPSAQHFWVKGHWSYNGREWVWVGGHWDVQRHGYTYVAPHWDMEHGHYRFMRGHWVRRA